MARPTLRIASGSADEPFSSVWRISADKKGGDVYITWTKAKGHSTKISLHESGQWRHAFTSESTLIRPDTNDRVLARFARPREHIPHVTRGPSILVPFTSAGHRTLFPDDLSPDVKWFHPPSPGHSVEFDLYFLGPKADSANWGNAHIMGHLALRDGYSLWVVATVRTDIPDLLFENAEKFMKENAVFHKSLDTFAGGNLIWTQVSEDVLQTPVFVDLPLLAYELDKDGNRSPLTAKGAPGRGRSAVAPTSIKILGAPGKPPTLELRTSIKES